jgi:hypothetical protein
MRRTLALGLLMGALVETEPEEPMPGMDPTATDGPPDGEPPLMSEADEPFAPVEVVTERLAAHEGQRGVASLALPAG